MPCSRPSVCSAKGSRMTRKNGIIIAIDGPAGSGKSTAAKYAAQRLNYLYLDSGAMYRAATLLVLQHPEVAGDEARQVQLVRSATIELIKKEEGLLVLLNGCDVSYEIRTPEVTRAIAPIAANPLVREELVKKQRLIGQEGGVVAEGRDIGTVVFPDAELKVFMTASLEKRAERRANELHKMGIEVNFEQILEEIRRRDESDMMREHGPLRRAKDALELDTTLLTIEQQVDVIVRWAKERGA